MAPRVSSYPDLNSACRPLRSDQTTAGLYCRSKSHLAWFQEKHLLLFRRKWPRCCGAGSSWDTRCTTT